MKRKKSYYLSRQALAPPGGWIVLPASFGIAHAWNFLYTLFVFAPKQKHQMFMQKKEIFLKVGRTFSTFSDSFPHPYSFHPSSRGCSIFFFIFHFSSHVCVERRELGCINKFITSLHWSDDEKFLGYHNLCTLIKDELYGDIWLKSLAILPSLYSLPLCTHFPPNTQRKFCVLKSRWLEFHASKHWNEWEMVRACIFNLQKRNVF